MYDGKVQRFWMACTLALAAGAARVEAEAVKPQLPAPPGFGVQLTREGLAWTSPDGMSLYTHFSDVPFTGEVRCEHGCPDAFAPVMAPPDAKPVGDWKAYDREGGKKQWAYKGWPLWRFVDDAKPGDSFGHGDYAEWHLLFYEVPPPKVQAPPGVALQLSKSGAYVLSDARGHTLYVGAGKQKCDASCLRDFPILAAPVLAHNLGVWSVKTGGDGISQWLYKGVAVHTSSFDQAAGDRHGEEKGRDWKAIEVHSLP